MGKLGDFMSNSFGGIMDGVSKVANTIISPIAAKRQQKRNQEYTKQNMALEQQYAKEMADYTNKINQENWKRENERQDWLIKNQKAMEVEGLRNANMSPNFANGVQPVGVNTSAPVSASSASAKPINYGSLLDGADIGGIGQSIAKTSAEIKLMKAQADNLESQTKGNEQKNFFTDQTMWDNIRMTKAEMNQKEAVANFMNENPELNMAVAKKQATLNENIEMDTSLKEAQISETTAREFLDKAQTHLSGVQAMALNDENLRNNSENVHWLLKRIVEVQHSSISANDKSDLLVLYGACLDNCSKTASDYRKGKIEDFLNYHKASYDSALSYEASPDDPFSDFVGNILQALAIGGGMRVFGSGKKSFNVKKQPQTKSSKRKAKSFEDDIVNSHKKTNRKD